jgi:hypothetical protein
MKDFFAKYETKIIILIGFVLISVISFEAGILKGKSSSDKPIIIEKDPETTKIELPETKSCDTVSTSPETNKPVESQNLPTSEAPKNCAFIGSKNSNKYHLPTCRWAKQIKEENKVCFSSAEDATSKNYLPDKNCIK